MWKGFLEGLRGLIKSNAPEDWNYTERRGLIRLDCMYEIEGRTESGKKFTGQIVDMGLKGMRLRTFEQVKAGDTLFIRYLVPILEVPTDTIRCKVLWSQSRQRDFVLFAGLGYDEPETTMAHSWVKYLLKQLGFSRERLYQKRKYVRAECWVPAQLIYGGNERAEGRLYNLGVGGALIEAAAPLEDGMPVQLLVGPYEELPAFTVPGKLASRRMDGRRYLHGVEFPDLDAVQARAVGRYLFLLLRQQWTE